MRKRRAGLGCAIVAVVTASALSARATPMDDAKFPALQDKAMGHVRHIVEIGRQLPGDWSHMGHQEPGEEYEDAYRYQLAFMTYVLALAQHSYVPAYRELYQDAIASFIEKMQRRDVWGYWMETSQYTDHGNPDAPLRQPLLDPVKRENIMYSGHLLMMVGLYEALFGDHRYDELGSISFKHGSYFFKERDRLLISHSHVTLAQAIHGGYVENDHIGITCEPNLIFSPCQQHAILGLLLFDHTHGTKLSEVSDKHRQWYETMFVDSESRRYTSLVRLNRREVLKAVPRIVPNAPKPIPQSMGNGWTGMFLHAWDKNYAESLYQTQIEVDLPPLLDRTYSGLSMQQSSLNFGFTAAYAAEMRDTVSVNKLLAFADQHFNPTWKDGRFYYPRNDVIPIEEVSLHSPPRYMPGREDYHMYHLTGSSLLALARINRGDGIWELFHRLPTNGFLHEPFISHVRYPEVLVERARYDADEKMLVVTIAPGTDYRGRTSFVVENLDPQASHVVALDGKDIGRLRAGVVVGGEGQLAWSEGKLRVNPVMDGRRNIVIREELR